MCFCVSVCSTQNLRVDLRPAGFMLIEKCSGLPSWHKCIFRFLHLEFWRLESQQLLCSSAFKRCSHWVMLAQGIVTYSWDPLAICNWDSRHFFSVSDLFLDRIWRRYRTIIHRGYCYWRYRFHKLSLLAHPRERCSTNRSSYNYRTLR